MKKNFNVKLTTETIDKIKTRAEEACMFTSNYVENALNTYFPIENEKIKRGGKIWIKFIDNEE